MPRPPNRTSREQPNSIRALLTASRFRRHPHHADESFVIPPSLWKGGGARVVCRSVARDSAEGTLKRDCTSSEIE